MFYYKAWLVTQQQVFLLLFLIQLHASNKKDYLFTKFLKTGIKQLNKKNAAHAILWDLTGSVFKS